MNHKKKEFIIAAKFTLFSISAGIIQTASFALLNELTNLEEWISHLIALVLSVLWNFTLNRNITFRSANNVPVAMLKVAAYYAVYTPFSTWGTAELNKIGWNSYIVFALFLILNFVTEFIYDRFFVFGKSIDTAKKR